MFSGGKEMRVVVFGCEGDLLENSGNSGEISCVSFRESFSVFKLNRVVTNGGVGFFVSDTGKR